MSSITCRNCGSGCSIVDTVCPTCGSALEQAGPYQRLNQESGNTPRVPVYGIPPPAFGAANLPLAPNTGIWRRGAVLVFDKMATLPDRCIRCNAPALGTRINKTLYWHHPALALLVLAGVLIYVVVAMVLRKSALVSLGFCELHKTRRQRLFIAGWLLFVLSFVSFFAALAEEAGGLALVGLVLLIAAIVVFVLAGRFIQVKRIDDHYVWLKGISSEYLDEFPQF